MVETIPLDAAQRKFREIEAELAEKHPGRFVAVGPDGLIGAFDSYRECIERAHEALPRGPIVTWLMPGPSPIKDEHLTVRIGSARCVVSPPPSTR